MKNELFDKDGCLTDQGLRMLISGELDELGRLEAAEHLAFCDRCTLRYSELLEGDILLETPDLLRPGIFRRIRQHARRIFCSRYAAMVVAASFAMVFWLSGVFTVNENVAKGKWVENFGRSTNEFTQATSSWSEGVADSLSDFFDNFDLKGDFSHAKK